MTKGTSNFFPAIGSKFNSCHAANSGQFCSGGGGAGGGGEGPSKVFVGGGHTLEYTIDKENRVVMANVDGNPEEIKVGDYFKKNDDLNFSTAINSHKDQFAVSRGIQLTEKGKTPQISSMARDIERSRRQGRTSAANVMRKR